MSFPFDPFDPEEIRRILVELRVAADDIDAVMIDMLRKKRRRSLGREQHKKLYRDALRKLLQILERLMPPPPASSGGGRPPPLNAASPAG